LIYEEKVINEGEIIKLYKYMHIGGKKENGSKWILVQFIIYLSTFRVEKLEELLARPILVAGPSLEIWGLEPSKAILRCQTIPFWVKIL